MSKYVATYLADKQADEQKDPGAKNGIATSVYPAAISLKLAISLKQEQKGAICCLSTHTDSRQEELPILTPKRAFSTASRSPLHLIAAVIGAGYAIRTAKAD